MCNNIDNIDNSFYKINLIPDNLWHDMIKYEYASYKKEYKPIAAAVTYLMYSGMSHPGFEDTYFTEGMADSYSNAFQVHQKPCKTAYIHKYWIRKLPYMWYLFLIATPVDIYAHIYQFINGEHDMFLEGGAFFIPYQISHWSIVSLALFAPYIYKYIPNTCWYYYFRFMRTNLIIHEYIYRYTIRKLSFLRRILEFSLFMSIIIFTYDILLT